MNQSTQPLQKAADCTTRKIMMLTLHVADYRLLEEMLAAARQRIPDMTMDSICSTIITEGCRCYRASVVNPV